MELLIATTRKDKSFSRLQEEARKKGFSVTKILYEELKIFPEQDFLKRFDFCILRDPYNTGVDFSKYLVYMKGFFNKKNLLDFDTLNNFPLYEDKLFQKKFFSSHNMEMAKFYHFLDVKDLNVMFPLIIKKRISSRGKEVFLVHSKVSAEEFFEDRDIRDYIFEEYVPIKKDYRVVVIGDKIIGGISRKVNIHKGRLKRIGVKGDVKVSVPDDIRMLVLKILKLIKCDFAGIDIFLGEDENLYFGECNVSPQFTSFEKITKINVAGLLMEFIKKRIL